MSARAQSLRSVDGISDCQEIHTVIVSAAPSLPFVIAGTVLIPGPRVASSTTSVSVTAPAAYCGSRMQGGKRLLRFRRGGELGCGHAVA